MIGPASIRIPSLSALAAGLLFSGSIAAQAPELRGVVLDERGEPVAALEVVLHRVATDGGAAIASATTAADGTFRFSLDAEDDAVFFAATRYRDLLHVGTPFRLPMPPDADYVIVVGAGGGAALGPARPGAARPAADPDGPGWWAWLIIPGVVLLVFAAVRWRSAREPTAWRRLLVRLAELEERRDAAPAGGPDFDAGERQALRARLRALAAASSRAHG